MKLLASLGIAAALSLSLMPAAEAHWVSKSFNCMPIEGNPAKPYQVQCKVSVVFGTVKDCSCGDGFALYNPSSVLNLPPSPDNATSG